MDYLEAEIRDGELIDEKKKKLFKTAIDILEEIKRICQKYGLRYFADSGTLIGAVRHKGFIPWDDDIDLRMPREDFERFKVIAPKELPSHYFLQTPITDPDWDYDIIKIRNSNTTQLEKWRIDERQHLNMGVWVSIFPLDGRPNNPHAAERVLFITRFVRLMFRRARMRSTPCLIRLALRLLLTVVGKKRLLKYKLNCYRQFPLEGSERCTGMHSLASYVGFNVPTSAYAESIEVPFEYTTISIPKGYDEVLTAMFGNWRKPVKDAACHETAEFDTETPYKEYVLKHYGYCP